MMEAYHFLTGHPFFSGLLLGLAMAVFVWVRGVLRQSGLKSEIEQLKESLYTKMQIETKGHVARENELEELKRQNGNLRITVGSLGQKPGRAEIRQLHVYDRAVHAMLARAPGFAASWEMVLKEAEEEVRLSETGLSAFVRRVFLPRKPPAQDETRLIESEKDGKE
jgi:hypothetical protein